MYSHHFSLLMLGYFLCLSFVKFLPCMKMFSSVPLQAAQGEGMWIATGTRTEGKPHSAGVYARGSHPQPRPHGSTSYRHLSFPQETVGPHTLLLNSQSVAPMYRNVKGVVVLFWRLDFFSYWHPWYKRTLFPHKREAIAAYNDGDQKRESKSLSFPHMEETVFHLHDRQWARTQQANPDD